MKTGIIEAMDKELHQLQDPFDKRQVVVQKCGIGKVNVALGAQLMINEFRTYVIINRGCAGSNGDDIQVQDIIIGSEVCNKVGNEALATALHAGLIVTGDWFVS